MAGTIPGEPSVSGLPLTRVARALPPLVPFVGPEALERRHGRPLRVRVGANESPFGVSPAARGAMRQAVDEVWMYNDPEIHDLIEALAAHHRVPPARVHVGAGIDEILGLLVRLFAEAGDPVVTSLGSYPTFNYHVHGYGARLVEVPYVDDRVDFAGLGDAARKSGAHLVYAANPDNPMGTWGTAEAALELLASLPAEAMLILDEAYSEFAPPPAVPAMDVSDRRLVRTRTFSKAHGMAGARIGYAIAHEEVVAVLDRVRNHFGVNRVAQAGGPGLPRRAATREGRGAAGAARARGARRAGGGAGAGARGIGDELRQPGSGLRRARPRRAGGAPRPRRLRAHALQAAWRPLRARHRGHARAALGLCPRVPGRPGGGRRPMRVLVSGPTGLVGSALIDSLARGGDEVLGLTRSAPEPGTAAVRWDPAAGALDAVGLEGFDAVVHLAGENVTHGRWTAARKERIRLSRVEGTRLLSEALAACERKPATLVCASAIGYYGDRGDEICVEETAPADDFLARVAVDWERATSAAAETGIRVVNLRIGVVLSPRGGMLARVGPLFRLGLGGRVGSGRQYLSWITLEDLVGVIEETLKRPHLAGPVNAVAPGPVTNLEFTRTMARLLRRPALLPLPAPVVKLVWAEMGQALLLASTRVEPARLAAAGYAFRHPDIGTALRDLLGKG